MFTFFLAIRIGLLRQLGRKQAFFRGGEHISWHSSFSIFKRFTDGPLVRAHGDVENRVADLETP